jgi:hypothetical protein
MNRGSILTTLALTLAATPALAAPDQEPAAAPTPAAEAPAEAPPAEAPPAEAPATEPAAAADPAPVGAPLPADARTWRYRGVISNVTDEGQEVEKKIDVDLVETGRRTVGERVVVDLAAARAGQRLAADALAELSPAPFTTFAPSISLVYGTRKEPSIWLLMGEAPASDAEIAAAVKERPTFRTAKSLPARAKIKMKPDTWLYWSDRVESWDSSCGGEEHPSPDSGDSYTSTICYAPSVGVSRIDFDSVWGSFDLVLTTRPTEPKLPN